MLKEIERYVPKHKFSLILEIIGIVFFILSFSWLCSAFRVIFDAPFIGYLPFPVAIVLVVYIYQKRIVEYRYTIVNDILKIEKIYGKRESVIANLSTKSIDIYTAYDKKNPQVKPRYKCIFSSSTNLTLLAYTQNGKQEAFVFSPSDRMSELILERMNEKEEPTAQ
ncbi:MAG: hypothetical protein IJF16_00735 [Clostridia bacterium]|nr:hypothetical protein [Clostridia bacterium]